MDIEGLGIILIISLLRCHSTDALSFIHLSISTDFQPKFLGLSTPQPTLQRRFLCLCLCLRVCLCLCMPCLYLYIHIYQSHVSLYTHTLSIHETSTFQ